MQNASSFIPLKIKYIFFLISRRHKKSTSDSSFVQKIRNASYILSICYQRFIFVLSSITFCYQHHSYLLFFIQHHAPASYRPIYYNHHTIIDKFCQYVYILDTRQTHEWLSAINPFYIRWYHSHNTSSIYSIQSNNSCIYQRPFSFNFIRKGTCSQFIYSCVCRVSSTVYSSISVFVTCLICFFFRRRYTNSRKIV